MSGRGVAEVPIYFEMGASEINRGTAEVISAPTVDLP